jgi:CrcB protein
VLAAIFAGGVVGTLARAGLAETMEHRAGHWPWQTFAVNILGTLLLGVFAARLREPSHRRLFLTTGLCGALTTFSTFQLELLHMLDRNRDALALGYASASIAAAFAAVVLGARLGRIQA